MSLSTQLKLDCESPHACFIFEEKSMSGDCLASKVLAMQGEKESVNKVPT
jgi:hypothetical protein